MSVCMQVRFLQVPMPPLTPFLLLWAWLVGASSRPGWPTMERPGRPLDPDVRRRTVARPVAGPAARFRRNHGLDGLRDTASTCRSVGGRPDARLTGRRTARSQLAPRSLLPGSTRRYLRLLSAT